MAVLWKVGFGSVSPVSPYQNYFSGIKMICSIPCLVTTQYILYVYQGIW